MLLVAQHPMACDACKAGFHINCAYNKKCKCEWKNIDWIDGKFCGNRKQGALSHILHKLRRKILPRQK